MRSYLLGVGVLFLASHIAVAEERILVDSSTFNESDGWSETALGVYTRFTPSGVERASVGASGAAYDQAEILRKIDDLKEKQRGSSGSVADWDQAIASFQQTLDDVGVSAAGPQIQASQIGGMCNNTIGYQFDSILSKSGTTGTLTGRSTLLVDNFGPPYPAPTAAVFGINIAIERSVGAPITATVSSNLTNTPVNPDGSQTLSRTVTGGPCLWAATFTSLRLYGTNCPAAGDYRSWYKEYPTCTP